MDDPYVGEEVITSHGQTHRLVTLRKKQPEKKLPTFRDGCNLQGGYSKFCLVVYSLVFILLVVGLVIIAYGITKIT